MWNSNRPMKLVTYSRKKRELKAQIRLSLRGKWETARLLEMVGVLTSWFFLRSLWPIAVFILLQTNNDQPEAVKAFLKENPDAAAISAAIIIIVGLLTWLFAYESAKGPFLVRKGIEPVTKCASLPSSNIPALTVNILLSCISAILLAIWAKAFYAGSVGDIICGICAGAGLFRAWTLIPYDRVPSNSRPNCVCRFLGGTFGLMTVVAISVGLVFLLPVRSWLDVILQIHSLLNAFFLVGFVLMVWLLLWLMCVGQLLLMKWLERRGKRHKRKGSISAERQDLRTLRQWMLRDGRIGMVIALVLLLSTTWLMYAMVQILASTLSLICFPQGS